MGSKNQHKNINADSVNIHTPSGSSASTSTKQVSKASKKAKVDTDTDTDGPTLSETFSDIGGRGGGDKRLGADFFTTEKKVLVLFGEIYSDEDKNIEITWETEPIIAAIVWSKSCNDKKQAGICVDDTGFAGWDRKHKVYLTYNSAITANKFCMKIINLTPPTPEPEKQEPEPDFSSFASNGEEDDETSKPKDSDVPSKSACSYSFSKGKNKGETCGKSVDGESNYCKTHLKTGSKQKVVGGGVGGVGGVVSAITSAIKQILSKDSTPLVALSEMIVRLESSDCASVLSEILKNYKTPQPKTKGESKEKTTESDAEFDSDTETKKKKKKKTKTKKDKDPDAPKRPLTPYILFCLAERVTVQSANPSMSGKDITSELGRLWQDLSEDKKSVYKKQYEDDKVRYASELSNYDSSSSEESNTKKKTEKKSPTGPKRGLTSYIFFCQQNRAIVKKAEPAFDAKDVTRELGRRWNALSETDKAPFVKLAEEDKLRYEKEKSESHSDEDTEPAKIKPSPKKTTKSKPKSTEEPTKDEPEQEEPTPLKRKADTPKTKGTDGFTNFVLQNRVTFESSNPTLKPKQIMSKLSEVWDDMDEEDKLTYNK